MNGVAHRFPVDRYTKDMNSVFGLAALKTKKIRIITPFHSAVGAVMSFDSIHFDILWPLSFVLRPALLALRPFGRARNTNEYKVSVVATPAILCDALSTVTVEPNTIEPGYENSTINGSDALCVE